ncbi:hypothetical protein PInf_010258 [Phytophthora infestans]|nr:hypothetical protein PInf_010258 [Phytophthora infestans]
MASDSRLGIMEASRADNMHTELSADDAVSQPTYRGRAKASANAHAAETRELEERKRQAPRHPTAQRVRTVRLTTQVHPDMLIPYLYGERGGRSINAIVNATGCTIDYCALSPDEPERSPQSHGYVMNFLVSAGSNDTLEDATRQLRTLVYNVQTHLQTKARSRPRAREEMEYYEEEDTSRGRRGRMSPRISGADVTEAAMASKRDAIPDERWANGSAGMEPESGWDMAPMQRVYYAPRARRERPRYIEVTDIGKERSEYNLYEYDDQRVGHEVEYPDEAVDLTSENAGAHGSLEFVDVPDRHQQVHRTHPRRSLKRPLSKLRNDGPPPPPIYRQRMPYIYDCTYDDEEDEWMTEDEEMAVAYGYPPQFRPMEIPVWSPAARGHPQMYKRRRIPQNDASLENGMNNEAGFEASGRERVVLPISRSRTSLMGQLDEAAENTRAEAYRGEANRVEIPTEDGSTASNASDTSAGNAVVDGENTRLLLMKTLLRKTLATVPCESEESAIDIAAERRECAHVEADQERDQEHLLPAQASIALIAGAQQSLYESQDTQPTAGVASPVELVVSDAIRINKQVIASLERVNKVEVHFAEAKASMSVQEDKFRHWKAAAAATADWNDTRKQELLGKLDSYVETLISEGEQTLEERVVALQTGLESILTTHGLAPPRRAVKSKPVASRLENTPTSKPVDPNHDENNDTVGMDWEDDGWFEESAAIDMVSDEDHVDDQLEVRWEYLAVKLEEDASLRWPRELPPFVLSLLARVISSDPQSYVMRATHKRLMDEIAKGDPYYYLHPTITAKETETSSPLPSSPSPPCEFGCRGASALKWERKLVSQISSRMKSFDNVAYSLARSSGGKEVLNRKKMNSIIRKLHLVAMQLHSLVSHLYCVKGQATCKEVDSLPVALNNSHFERKMGVYKSRLKLVVPHKYQQQTQQQQSSVSEPAEELLRDTYEFFPELLLCVDIWGYNYRESQAKRHNSKSLLGDELAGSGALFPLGFFRRVESLAFDFEHDSNGLLRCICDELLNIVCLWNDFKWTDNLETVALDRVISFETDVTASIVKILELYAHHLQALWAVRLLDEPEQLQSVHLTQLNAYYSDGSQGSLNTSAASRSQAPKSPGDGHHDASTVDRLVADEIAEQRLAEEYWNRKVTALSVHNPDDDAMDVGDGDTKSAQHLSAETISTWDQQTLVSYLLRWSDVYAIRSDVNALSAVTNHMLKHEVQKYKFASRENSGSKTVVDSATRHLLAAVSRAQMLIRDALIGSEKLALHSASSQLPDERKHSMYAEGDEVDEDTSSSNKTAEDTSSNDAAHSSTVSDATHCLNSEQTNATNSHMDEETNVDACVTQEQPELKDLVQLLAVTKQDMQELCGHRPRSARMREKVQTSRCS